jgi:hypothetical protein
MSIVYKVVTDEEIDVAFLGTNFGTTNYREILNISLLKRFMDYHCGHTITTIMIELGLISKTTLKPRRKGVLYLRETYGYFVTGKGG